MKVPLVLLELTELGSNLQTQNIKRLVFFLHAHHRGASKRACVELSERSRKAQSGGICDLREEARHICTCKVAGLARRRDIEQGKIK